VLQVDPAHPVALALQVGDEVVADETTGAGDQDTRLGVLRHADLQIQAGPGTRWRGRVRRRI
jgi:hypothetical protein